MFNDTISFIRSLYGEGFIPLHEPRFIGNEKVYLEKCIDSTFVSSVGEYVDQFEEKLCKTTGAKHAIATVNGTAALHISLLLSDVKRNDEVLTQALTFVATSNAVAYTGAHNVFIDSSKDNLGMCPEDLRNFLEEYAELRDDGFCYNKSSHRRIKACLPMHVFGHPVAATEILEICSQYNISMIEDAAESLGSYYKEKHTGTIAQIGILSFNGNKILTSGGGGALLIQDETLAKRAKHLSTTAKSSHRWEFFHDEIGFNYRLPNLNAALACAQFEKLDDFLENKRETASKYRSFFKEHSLAFVDAPKECASNFWLNAVKCADREERDHFLVATNDSKIMTRPVWRLMPDLPAFQGSQSTELKNARDYEQTIVNIPSSVRL